ncbi:MAG: M50 family metallopeptidase [Candidatus Pacearchaeota archaeon]|nr:M50 family metallopeptidase [Candidatus Pacearchaeota archaeon]
MITIIFIVLTNSYLYVAQPKKTLELTDKSIPIAPVIPYFPQIFKMEKFFPDFYFVYFIIVFSIVAVFHEMAHGIYMVLYKVRIKSTGFLFLGPILGAFVEQDDKEFKNKKNTEQMAVLGAGVFTNLLLSIIFGAILLLFFFSLYQPSGYLITGYAKTQINVSEISSLEGIENNLTLITTIDGKKYLLSQKEIDSENISNYEKINVNTYSPAILNNLSGYITEIDGKSIRKVEDIPEILKNKKPGEKIKIKTELEGLEKIQEITLGENPMNKSVGFLGVAFITKEQLQRRILEKGGNIIKRTLINLSLIRNPLILYKPKINKDVADYFYYLIWWAMMINLFVALFNMLPFGIFDGGRFSYLLILSIIKSKEKAEKIYKIISSIIILAFLLIIFSWFFARLVFY